MFTATRAPAAIVPVRDRADRDRFISLPWRIYADDPAWVPPLRSDVRKLMASGHPFHQHAETEFFLALDSAGEVVGRIAAAVNHVYNDFHDTRTGFIGLFESVDDSDVATLLLDTAGDWLRAQGMTEAIGPFNLSTNDELYSPGIQLDAFDRPPTLLMAHNRPYYSRLFEDAGWEKRKDLLSYWLRDRDLPPERLLNGMERMTGRIQGLELRQIRLRELEREVELVKEIYNSAWEKNWGFAPLTEAEIEHLAATLKPIIDERFAMLALVHGEPIGFALALPDYNQALRHVNGRLFPLGLLKLLWHRRHINRLRVFTLGLKPEYRRKGIDALFYLRIYQNGVKAGFHEAEASWILEDNWGMRRGLERMGGQVYKTYRVYGTRLD
ncbi:MAG: N-acetyltransferase family protein [Gemmatimonadota bacterium]